MIYLENGQVSVKQEDSLTPTNHCDSCQLSTCLTNI